jgi:type IV pilus modification protein PilV
MSLLEVLIALSLLAIVSTGLAMLHGATRQAARQAALSASVFAMAVELADWHRNTAHALTPQALEEGFASLQVAADSSVTSCFQQDCSPAQMLAFDLSQWHQRVLRLIPAARIKVCRALPAAAWRWQCAEDAPLTAPLMIRIGWPLPATVQDFPPSISLAVGALAR